MTVPRIRTAAEIPTVAEVAVTVRLPKRFAAPEIVVVLVDPAVTCVSVPPLRIRVAPVPVVVVPRKVPALIVTLERPPVVKLPKHVPLLSVIVTLVEVDKLARYFPPEWVPAFKVGVDTNIPPVEPPARLPKEPMNTELPIAVIVVDPQLPDQNPPCTEMLRLPVSPPLVQL